MRHIEITTYIGCPNMCSYCPQKLLIDRYRGDRVMTISTLKNILSNVPKDVDVHFSGFSDIFLHKEAVAFIKEAMKSHSVVVYTTTRGITDEVYNEIKDLPFKEFNVHDIGNVKEIPFATTKTVIDDKNKISRGGNLWEVKEHNGVCKKSPRFEQNVVLPNGDAYICCMDYGLRHKLGNLLDTNFNNLKRNKTYELCRSCEWFV
jgi:hypothetical protein